MIGTRASLTSTFILAFAFTATAGERIVFKPPVEFIKPSPDIGECSATAISPQGEVFVFHRGPHPVLCLDAEGKLLRSWGDGEIGSAHGMRFDPEGNLWLTDVGGHRVFKFDSHGKLLLTLGTGQPGDGPDQFNKPTDIAFDRAGNVYISDGYGNSRVMKFNAHGVLIKSWGKKGRGKGEFNLPHSIVIDANGRILVGDRENNRIQIFDSEGKLLDIWRGYAPYGMAIDPDGNLFVADGRACKILRIDERGRAVQFWGRPGNKPGQFLMPHMLSFDADGNLYVAEVTGKRVQKFVREK